MDLRYLIDPHGVQEIQNKFSEANLLASIIADSDGNAITRASNFSELCRMVRSTPEGQRRCFVSDKRIGQLAAKKCRVQMHYCHMGLIDLAAPIILDSVYYGAVLCGQVLLKRPGLKRCRLVGKTADELGLNPKEALKAFKKIKVVDKKQVKASAELLHLVSNYIVEVGVNKKNQLMLMKEKNRQAELEKSLRTLELQRLQSQVNPHFLINTLNAVMNLAFLEGADQTVAMVNEFAKLLRYNLSKTDQMVALVDEFESMQRYLYIQQKRFGDRIKSKTSLPADLTEASVPFMTLQPILENAIIHGLEPKVEGGLVTVAAKRAGRRLLLEVKDYGIGIESHRLEKIITSSQSSGKNDITGIGLYNLRERLKLLYGLESSLEISSTLGESTTVRISIPISLYQHGLH